jgi:hypothetical protein
MGFTHWVWSIDSEYGPMKSSLADMKIIGLKYAMSKKAILSKFRVVYIHKCTSYNDLSTSYKDTLSSYIFQLYSYKAAST